MQGWTADAGSTDPRSVTTAPGDDRLDRWAEALAAQEDTCPWPGPRPFRKGTRYPLVGRDRDRERFRHVVEQHRLVFLTGQSGVGKSSLLEAGLVPELEAAGYTVLICREWSGKESAARPADFLAGKVREALARERSADELARYATDRSLFWQLRDELGPQGVLVLDQFEELIRYAPMLRDRMYALLAEINARLPLKLVLSFRDEYLLQLRRLEQLAQPFSIAQYVLEEVDPRHVRDIVTSANGLSDRAEAIAADAAEQLVDAWKNAREDLDHAASADPGLRIGLLHLQALLYTLHARRTDGCITGADVDAFAAGRSGAALFLAGLRDSIDVKLDRCRAAAEATGLDPYLVEGTAHIVARAVRHLSSAGYKLVREAGDLAHATMRPEIATLVDDDADPPLGSLLDTVLDAVGREAHGSRAAVRLLDASRLEIARAADVRRTEPGHTGWAERVRHDGGPAGADPAELTAGPMRGLPPAAVLVEELRRFAFALAWLEKTSLVRLSTAGGGGLMVSLIHDGFGEALLTWSDVRLLGPRGALYGITAPRGASFDWRGRAGEQPDSQSPLINERPRAFTNLRWRGAGVHVHLRRVVFVNCDFRSTFFRSCLFDGVTFLNCQLENVVFMRCSITERPADERAPRATGRHFEEPTFEVPAAGDELCGVDASWRRVAAAYRDAAGGPFALISQTPELPAVPVPEPAPDDVSDWTPALGGVALYGCRVSSMVIRAGDGDVTLRQCFGSGFHVVEHAGGSIDVHDSVLRQVQFTGRDPAHPLHVRVQDSALAQVWLGDTTSGTFAAAGGTLLQVWNESTQLAATATDAAIYGTVGVALSDCRPLPDLPGYGELPDAIRSHEAFRIMTGERPADR